MIKNICRFISSILVLLFLFLTLTAAAEMPSFSPGEWDVLRYTNMERLLRGLRPLTMTALMQQAAGTRADELNKSMSHTRPDGSSCFTALNQNGLNYSSAAENIAAGYRSAGAVVTAWMNSPGHKSNILNPNFAHIGVGEAANSAGTLYWDQLFMSQDCSYQGLRLIIPEGSLTCIPGIDIEELNIVAVLTCSVHGDSYLPLNTQMCSPALITQAGKNLIQVEIAGFHESFEVEASASPVESGWYEGPKGWMFFKDNILLSGWFQDGITWFYANETGLMQTGWINKSGSWCYLDKAGAMKTGWANIDGSWYYFDASGSMKIGWLKTGSGWFYTNASGVMQTGWTKIDGSWYYMNASGQMQTGWVKDGGTWYFMNTSGQMQTGWLQQNSAWYYLFRQRSYGMRYAENCRADQRLRL